MANTPLIQSLPIIGKYLKSESLLKKHSLEEQHRIGEEFRSIVGLGKGASFSNEAFNDYDKAKVSDYNAFAQTKGPAGISIHKMLSENSDEAKIVRQGIAKALTTPNPSNTPQGPDAPKDPGRYQKAKDNFNESIATFSELVKQIPQKFTAEALLSTMKEIKDDARKAIVEQHHHEVKMLEEQFKDPAFAENLLTALQLPGKPGDEEGKKSLEAVKKAFTKDLTAAHDTELAKFDKTTDESLKKLHAASAAELKQIAFIAHLRSLDEENKIQFEKWAAEARAEANPGVTEPERKTGIGLHVSDDGMKISGLTLDQIKSFKTLTGRTIHQSSPGVFTVNMPAINPRYNQDPRQKPLTDMLAIAQAAKALDNDVMTFTVSFKDPETQKIRLKEAFEAGIRAGFDPKNIKLKDGSGKELKVDEVFADSPTKYQKLMEKARSIKQHEEERVKTPPKNPVKDIATVREALQAQRQINADKKAKEAEETATKDNTSDNTSSPSLS